MDTSSDGAVAGWPPHPRTSLIGREADCAGVRRLLLETVAPLVTLTGPGGVGKTRLALAAAMAAAPHFADGAIWVDLAPVDDAQLVAERVAVALGVAPEAGRSAQAAITAVLRRQQRLLVLDNCEHLAPAVADLAAGLLAACPAVQILATSRASLRISGEHQFPVAPLATPPVGQSPADMVAASPAVALFVERARAAAPRFVLTVENGAAVAELCRRLDGLPLALELAAARAPLLTHADTMPLATARLQAEGAGLRDTPARHQSLQQTIAWSYVLLTQSEQRLLRNLAVFTGGCSLDAVAAVCERSAAQALVGLEALIAQNLVVDLPAAGGEPPRFAMLETIRVFSQEQLTASGDEPGARARHARWCMALAERVEPLLTGRDQRLWFAVLDRELENLRAALAWCAAAGKAEMGLRLAIALCEFWDTRGLWPEGLGWLRRWLDAEVAPGLLATGRLAAAYLARWCGEVAEARTHAEAVLRLAPLDDEAGERQRALASSALAVVAELTGEPEAGDAWLTKAMAATLNPGDRCELLYDVYVIARMRGERDRATGALVTMRDLAVDAGSMRHTIFALQHLAILAREAGDHARARALGAAFTHLAEETADAPRIAAGAAWMGLMAGSEGDFPRAGVLLLRALGLLRDLDARMRLVGVLEILASVAFASERAGVAAELLGVAHAQRRVYPRSSTALGSEEYGRLQMDVQAALGAGAFAMAWEAGCSRTWEHALAYAFAVAAQIADLGEPAPASLAGAFGLTRREHDVLRLLGQRRTDREIAAHLFISQKTASTHVGKILSKLGAENRRDAAAIAVRHALI